MNYDIERLLKLRDELNTVSDEINKGIAEFEADLKKVSMGVEVWLKLSETSFIGYRRFEGDWKIIIRHKDFPGGEEKVTPLDRSTRTLRLHGYRNMHLLLPAIEKCAERLTIRMRKALGGIDDGYPEDD